MNTIMRMCMWNSISFLICNAHVHFHYKVSQQICKYNRNLCSMITCIAMQVHSQASNEWNKLIMFTKQKHQLRAIAICSLLGKLYNVDMPFVHTSYSLAEK